VIAADVWAAIRPYAGVVASQVSDQRGTDWAESLQDGTLQGLVALRMLLRSGINQGSHGALAAAAKETVGQLDHEIRDLRGLIAEMRIEEPAADDSPGRSSRFR
jgi:hypothetical protein